MSPSENRSGSSKTNRSLRRFYRLDGLKPFSLNEAYATMQAKNKDPKAKQPWKNKFWRRKTAQAERYQWEIQETLAATDQAIYGDKLTIPTAEDYQGIALTLVFFIPPNELRVQDHSKFKGRDVSNYVKLIEDAVFEYLGRTDGGTYPQERAKIQDSSSIEPLSFKRASWDDDWHIFIYLSDHVFADESGVFHAGRLIDVYAENWTPHAGTLARGPSDVRQLPSMRPLPQEPGREPTVPPSPASRQDRPPM
jgi:hypothetical protein